MPFRQAQAQYLGRDGDMTALTQNIAGHTNASLDLTGAIVLMDNSVQPSRASTMIPRWRRLSALRAFRYSTKIA